METFLALCQKLERTLVKCPARKVFLCGRHIAPPNFSHVVTFPRLEIPLKGRYENQIEQNNQLTTVCLQPGDILFVASNCWNLPSWRLNVELVSLLFGNRHIGISHVLGTESGRLRMNTQKHSTLSPLTGPLPHILNALMELHAAGEPQEAFADLTLAAVRCVRDLLQNPKDQTINRTKSLLEAVCLHLQNNYQYEITRDHVAQQFEISPSHLSRIFHSQGNMTFNNYLNHVRINRSKYLLCNYNLKLDDIADQCGFRDTPYFCRVFKRITKIPPAEYRATHR